MKSFPLLLLILFSCQTSPCKGKKALTHFRGHAMEMPYTITIACDLSEGKKIQVQAIIDEVFEEIDKHMNNWNPHSEISLINKASAEKPLPLSPSLHKLLLLTDQVHRMTGQRFDPTIDPILKMYRQAFAKGMLPLEEKVAQVKEQVGWDKLVIEEGTILKKTDKLSLDLCGISKGYAIDLITEKLKRKGFLNFMVEWSGEIRASGKHPNERPWKIKIFGTNDSYTFPLSDLAIATSGDYVFNWDIEDDIYFHIIDSFSKTPKKRGASTIASVSCVAPSCALADALATTAMTFEDAKEARHWADEIVSENSLICFWIISHNDLHKKNGVDYSQEYEEDSIF